MADNTGLTLAGAIANSGKISLSATTHQATLTIAAAGATLSGTGAVTLSANADNLITGATSAASLTNVDNKITGSGNIGGGVLTLVNQAKGLIEQTGAVALTVDTGANTITNAGTIEAGGAGGMTIDSAIANTGLIEAVKGNLTVNGAVTGTGTAAVNAGTLYFTSSFSENVKFSATGVLELAQSTGYGGTISGLSTTGANQLDLQDITYTKGVTTATFSGTTKGGTLTVTDGSHTASIKLTGNYTTSTFVTATDNHNGTLVYDPAASPSPAAFASAMAGLGSSSAEVSPSSTPAQPAAATLSLAKPATHSG